MSFQYVKTSILFSVCAIFVVCDASNVLVNSDEDYGIDCSAGKYHPHELYCNWYYECIDGRPRPVECPAGLQFNNDLGSCVLPEESNCNVSL